MRAFLRSTTYSHSCVSLLLSIFWTVMVSAQVFPPTPYLSVDDRPEEFCEECVLEDFEDNLIDEFLTFDCGEILGPNVADPRIPGVQITDSVDGDDGSIDGNGNGGHSYFCVDPARAIQVSFANPVAAAGAVWTDGDRGVAIQIEAFDIKGDLLAMSEPEVVADASYFGETAEDRFLGIQASDGISSIRVSTVGQGAGIEIDHVTWDAKELGTSTEPPSLEQVCSAVSGASTNLLYDLNFDGVVNSDDVSLAISSANSLIGDLNLDGTVGFEDFLTLSGNFGAIDATYSQGDINCDAQVAFGDFLSLSGNFGQTAPTESQSVPEPTGAALALMAFIMAGCCRISRSR